MATLKSHVFLLLLFLLAGHVVSQTGTDVKNLLDLLFTTYSYDKRIRPVADQTQVLDVNVDFYLTSIIDFDEQEEVLKTSGYLALEWQDEFLDWNPGSFGGLVVLFLPQDDIWRPDISLRNTYEKLKDTGMGSQYLNARIVADGSVYWEPLEIFTSTCDVDTTYYPFDVQTCKLKFTAWSYRQSEVTLTKGSRGVVLNNYNENSVWDLVDHSAEEITTDETAVVFTLKLKRKPSFFLISYIAPIVLLTVLNMCTFILPVPYGERASYAITVFLSLAVFLTIFAAELPQNSDTVSLLAIYLMLMSCFSTAVVLVSLFQCRLRERDRAEPHPPPVNKLYRSVYLFYRCIRCRGCKRKNAVQDVTKIHVNPENKDNVDVEPSQEMDVTWMNVIDAIDFLCFYFSLAFTFVSTTALAAVAYNSSKDEEPIEIPDENRFF